MSMTIETTKLSDTVGVQVLGVDLDMLLCDEELPQWTLAALEANGVLVFPQLHIDDAAQVALSKRLGRVEVLGKGEHPEVFRVTLDPAKNRAAAYLKGTFDWHIDGLTEDVPIMATLLSAHAVDESGGDTEFASTYAAYDALTYDEKDRFKSFRVVHTLEATQRRQNPDPSPAELAAWRSRPAKVHPLIWRHRSSRSSLVLRPTAERVVGMDREEGTALLESLMVRATAPNRVCRHRWRVGDLVIWDNRGVVHRALPYDPASARDMHRTTLYGDEKIQ